jgi:tetratricopeptide (TPR) repeat protein
MKNYQKADESLQKYADLLPGDANPYDSMAEYYIRTGRINLAIEQYKTALEIKPDFGSEWRVAWLYGYEEDFQSAISWLERFQESSRIRSRQISAFFWKGLFKYYAGCRRAALADLNKSIDISRESNIKWGVTICEFFKGWIFFDQERFTQCKKSFKNYYNYRVDAYPQYLKNHKADHAFYMGLLLAAQGKSDSARAELTKIKGIFPELTPIAQERHIWAENYLYSRILASRDSLAKALEIRNKKRTLDRPFSFVMNYLVYNFPISHDYLAQAYLRHGRIDSAITEYRLLTDEDPEKRGYRMINPLYHYQLAKLLQQKGSISEAKKKYSRFLEIWKNADKDIPEYLDAQKQLLQLARMAAK